MQYTLSDVPDVRRRTNSLSLQSFARPEHAFLLLGLLFGIIFTFVTPPLQVPDEWSHLYRAYHVSKGQLVHIIPRAYIPKNLHVTVGQLTDDIPFHPDHKQTVENILATFRIPLDETDQSVETQYQGMLYSPIPYIPAALAIGIARLFNAPPVLLIYAGRLANVLAAVLIIFYAIKITPIFKWVFFLLALTPMAVFQQASLSADCLTNAIALLLTCVCLYYAFGNVELLRRRDIALLFVLSVSLALCKPSYVLIPILYLLIPRKKIGGTKKYVLIFASLLIWTFVPMLIWSYLVRQSLIALTELQPYLSVDQQKNFILTHPWEFIQILFRTFQVYGLMYIYEFIGALGWLDTGLPQPLIVSQIAVLISAALLNGSRTIRISFLGKVLIGLLFFMSVVLTVVPHYFVWTPVGWPVIEGPQGRYFIPIAPLFFLIFYNTRMNNAVIDKVFPILLVTFSCFSLLITINILIERYYVPPNEFKADLSATRNDVGEILPGHPVIQDITCQVGTLTDLQILFSTYQRVNTSKITITLAEDGKQVVNQTVSAADIPDTNWFSVKLPQPIQHCYSKQLSLTVASDDGTPGNTVSLWTFPQYYPGQLHAPTAREFPDRSVAIQMNVQPNEFSRPFGDRPDILVPILPGQPIIQDITCQVETLTDLQILFHTYQRVNTSKITITLAEDGRQVVNQTVLTSNIHDGDWFSIKLPQPIQHCYNKRLSLTVASYDGTPDNTVTVWTFPRYYPGELHPPIGTQFSDRSVAIQMNTPPETDTK